MEPLEIDCKTHGKGIAACVCRHLLDEPDGKHFIENSSEPGDLQAWCNLCEDVFLEEGDMTERFKEFHALRLVCESCYSSIRARCTNDDV